MVRYRDEASQTTWEIDASPDGITLSMVDDHATTDDRDTIFLPAGLVERISKPGMTIGDASRKGGNTTKERYGPKFYSEIGKKGGRRVAAERGPEFYAKIGRLGGSARVKQSRDLEAIRQ